MTITIDSNIINLKKRHAALNKLEELHVQGKIKIVGAERLFEEMRNYKPEAFDKADSYSNIGEPFVVGLSRIGHAYIAADDQSSITFRQLKEILFPDKDLNDLTPNEENDVMHLLAHAHSDSDVFVTSNTRDFVNGKRTNKNRQIDLTDATRNKLRTLGIKIMTPEEIINEIQ